MVEYKDFHTPNITKLLTKKNGAAILTVLLALLIIVSSVNSGTPSLAADLVCGDGDREAPEECDDGNLQSGDGCSNTCNIELCGNHSIDVNEQCDDGNLNSNDGCNQYCQIEFCGDRVIQEVRGEQCDDGNGISGDGCSGSCTLENVHSAPPDDTTKITKNDPSPPPPVSQQYVPPAIVTQAIQANTFLSTEAGQDYKNYLTSKQMIELETIMKKLANGRRLTKQEREWAQELFEALQLARLAERVRYTDLLKQFIATPISSEVVDEKNLQKSNLVDVEVPIAIDELKRAVSVIRRGELQSAVTFDLARLKRQGIDLAKDVPTGFEQNLTVGNRPILVFATLKNLKEAAEQYATTDVQASLSIVRTEAQSLKQALPIFEQEYGARPEDIEPLFAAIEHVSQEATKQDVERVVAAINRFMMSLERNKILTKADIASFERDPLHAAAGAKRIAATVGLEDQFVSMDAIEPFLDGLSASAPDDARDTFAHGTLLQQRKTLSEFLANNERVTQLRAAVRKKGNTQFDDRYQILQRDISVAGENADTVTLCDDSVSDALTCVHQFLADLENAVRTQSFFGRIIGNLQDYFGIGS